MNSRQLRNSQLTGGLEIELLACRRALAEAEERDRSSGRRSPATRSELDGLERGWRRSTASLPRN